MISSVFGKTKPVIYIILLGFLFLFYWFVQFYLFQQAQAPEELLYSMLVFGILLFSVFIMDYVVKSHKITKSNSFAMLFFVLLVVIFPEVLTDDNAIWCNFFLLLAVRRLLDIRSLKEIKLKIFDATLWITVASLFYDWALFFLLLVYLVIYIYDAKNGRNWLVPLAAVFTVFMIVYAYLVLMDNTEFLRAHYRFHFRFYKEYFMRFGNSIKLLLYTVVTLVAGIISFVRLRSSGSGKIVSLRLMALYFLLGLATVVLIYTKNAYPVILLFFPSAIFISNFIESLKNHRAKEIVLFISITIPFLALLGQILDK
ncbi:MAG: DUF6427 family protein [Sediminicola sp.]